MFVRDLNGKIVKWSPKETSSKDTRAKSGLHSACRELLQEKYPTFHILEEVQIPVRRNSYLYLDFYSPLTKTAYEVHGQQHYNYTPHFHANLRAFAHQKVNDREKQEWCEINGITLVILPYNKQEEWKDLI